MASQLLQESIVATNVVDLSETVVAPVVLLHGIDDRCPRDDWTNMISAAIGGQAEVKCVEIGDGRPTSKFTSM